MREDRLKELRYDKEHLESGIRTYVEDFFEKYPNTEIAIELTFIDVSERNNKRYIPKVKVNIQI